jgi:hypothetical protein
MAAKSNCKSYLFSWLHLTYAFFVEILDNYAFKDKPDKELQCFSQLFERDKSKTLSLNSVKPIFAD